MRVSALLLLSAVCCVVFFSPFLVEGGGKVVVQQPAPDFTAEAVLHGEFKKVSLSDYEGKYVVILFYPLDFTFVCPTELTTLSDSIAEFKKLNTEVLAVSIDSKFSHLAWTKLPRSQGGLGKMDIPLVADITKQISKDYGVLIEEGADQGVALRGTFIVNEKGIVRHVSINDLPVGRNVDELLRLVKAFQFTDTHDEVCPMNWHPGKDTMKPGPEEAKAYFSKLKDQL